MLDSELAGLYEVTTRVLNQAVRRNLARFPSDFMFQLDDAESNRLLRSQSVISKSTRGGRRYRPFAFTEQGVAMLSTVLHSSRAIEANIEIMRAFVRLRRILASDRDLAQRLDELEERYDGQFKQIFEAIRQLMAPVRPSERKIGFES